MAENSWKVQIEYMKICGRSKHREHLTTIYCPVAVRFPYMYRYFLFSAWHCLKAFDRVSYVIRTKCAMRVWTKAESNESSHSRCVISVNVLHQVGNWSYITMQLYVEEIWLRMNSKLLKFYGFISARSVTKSLRIFTCQRSVHFPNRNLTTPAGTSAVIWKCWHFLDGVDISHCFRNRILRVFRESIRSK